MPNLNNVMLMGHLAREVDLRYTAQHKPVAEMTIAVNRRNGEREEVCFVDVVMWGKTAESCRRYLSKGSCVYVEGYLKQEHWEDRQTGQRRSRMRVVAESVQFISTPSGGQTRTTGPNPAQSGRVSEEYAPPPRDSEPEQTAEDDIPF